MKKLVTTIDKKAMTTSKIVAEAFEKEHRTVLRSIRDLECSDSFNRHNFVPITYDDERNRKQPAFNITRDGFMWLAMGFTGPQAAAFKERFIAAFNAMEEELRGKVSRVAFEHNAERRQGNPHGIDIRYGVDITKVIMHPTRERLEVLGKITGIDFSDVELPRDQVGPDVASRHAAVVGDFVAARCHGTPLNQGVRYKAFYECFVTWYAEAIGDSKRDRLNRPTKQAFSKVLRELGYLCPSDRTTCGTKYLVGICFNGADDADIREFSDEKASEWGYDGEEEK